jgi:hypothetical protein
VVIVLIIGGYISNAISKQGASAIPGLQTQTNNPNGNVEAVTTVKGAQFFVFTVIALGSVVGMGVTLAFLFWLLNRGVVEVKEQPDVKLKSKAEVLLDIVTLGRYSRRRLKAEQQ